MFEAAELPSLSLPDQNACIKLVFRDASMHARDSLFESDPHSNHAMTLRFSSISRAVFLGDEKLARTLLGNSELAREHMAWDPD